MYDFLLYICMYFNFGNFRGFLWLVRIGLRYELVGQWIGLFGLNQEDRLYILLVVDIDVISVLRIEGNILIRKDELFYFRVEGWKDLVRIRSQNIKQIEIFLFFVVVILQFFFEGSCRFRQERREEYLIRDNGFDTKFEFKIFEF